MYVTGIMAFFMPLTRVTFSQFYPLCYLLRQQAMDWERRRFFVYMSPSAYHVISKEVENL